MSWQVVYTNRALKDARKIAHSGLKARAKEILVLLEEDPFRTPPPFEKLVGDLAGLYSRRINVHHRIVYQIHRAERVVKILRMWTHYE